MIPKKSSQQDGDLDHQLLVITITKTALLSLLIKKFSCNVSHRIFGCKVSNTKNGQEDKSKIIHLHLNRIGIYYKGSRSLEFY